MTSAVQLNQAEQLFELNEVVVGLARRAAGLAEVRGDSRFPLHQPVQIGRHAGDAGEAGDLPAAADPAGTITGFGVDLSLQGIGLITSDPLKPGSELHVSFEARPGQHLELRVRVRRCRRIATGLHDVGAQFLIS